MEIVNNITGDSDRFISRTNRQTEALLLVPFDAYHHSSLSLKQLATTARKKLTQRATPCSTALWSDGTLSDSGMQGMLINPPLDVVMFNIDMDTMIWQQAAIVNQRAMKGDWQIVNRHARDEVERIRACIKQAAESGVTRDTANEFGQTVISLWAKLAPYTSTEISSLIPTHKGDSLLHKIAFSTTRTVVHGFSYMNHSLLDSSYSWNTNLQILSASAKIEQLLDLAESFVAGLWKVFPTWDAAQRQIEFLNSNRVPLMSLAGRTIGNLLVDMSELGAFNGVLSDSSFQRALALRWLLTGECDVDGDQTVPTPVATIHLDTSAHLIQENTPSGRLRTFILSGTCGMTCVTVYRTGDVVKYVIINPETAAIEHIMIEFSRRLWKGWNSMKSESWTLHSDLFVTTNDAMQNSYFTTDYRIISHGAAPRGSMIMPCAMITTTTGMPPWGIHHYKNSKSEMSFNDRVGTVIYSITHEDPVKSPPPTEEAQSQDLFHTVVKSWLSNNQAMH
jgi:hypothetical protein